MVHLPYLSYVWLMFIVNVGKIPYMDPMGMEFLFHKTYPEGK